MPKAPRDTLIVALDCARKAVELDTSGMDPHGAIEAYRQSTFLLCEVIEKLQQEQAQGADTNGQRTKELERIAEIHKSYWDRMLVLCEVFGLPPSQVGEIPGGGSEARL